jgi:hypothetical protein
MSLTSFTIFLKLFFDSSSSMEEFGLLLVELAFLWRVVVLLFHSEQGMLDLLLIARFLLCFKLPLFSPH